MFDFQLIYTVLYKGKLIKRRDLIIYLQVGFREILTNQKTLILFGIEKTVNPVILFNLFIQL